MRSSYEAALQLLERSGQLGALGYVDTLKGACHFALGDFEKALQIFDDAIANNPKDSTSYRWRARIYFALGDKTSAERDRRRAKKISEEWAKRGRSKLKEDDFSVAILDACRKNDIATAQLLIDEGASLESRDQEKMTPLLIAANAGYEELALFLLSCGADINARSMRNHTALHFACKRGLLVLGDTLIQKGADINDHRNWDGEPPLCCAVKANSVKLFNRLVAAGANVHYKKHHQTLLFVSRDRRITDALIDAGLYIEYEDLEQRTALHGCIGQLRIFKDGRRGAIEALVEHGANVNAEDRLKHTPLYEAASAGDDCHWRPLTLEEFISSKVEIRLE